MANFNGPGGPVACQRRPPPKWKTALITAMGIYPLVLFLFPCMASLTASLAPWLGKLLTVAVAISLMTWGIVPLLTYLFSGWLYPTTVAPHANR